MLADINNVLSLTLSAVIVRLVVSVESIDKVVLSMVKSFALFIIIPVDPASNSIASAFTSTLVLASSPKVKVPEPLGRIFIAALLADVITSITFAEEISIPPAEDVMVNAASAVEALSNTNPPVPASNSIVNAFASTIVDSSAPIVIVLADAFVPILIAPVLSSVPIPIVPEEESIVKLPSLWISKSLLETIFRSVPSPYIYCPEAPNCSCIEFNIKPVSATCVKVTS